MFVGVARMWTIVKLHPETEGVCPLFLLLAPGLCFTTGCSSKRCERCERVEKCYNKRTVTNFF